MIISHNFYGLRVWLIIVLYNIFVPEMKPLDWHLLLLQCRSNFSGKGKNRADLGKVGWLELCLSGLKSLREKVSLVLLTPYLSVFGLQSQFCSAGGFQIAGFCIYFYSFWGLHHQRPGWGLQPEIYIRLR